MNTLRVLSCLVLLIFVTFVHSEDWLLKGGKQFLENIESKTDHWAIELAPGVDPVEIAKRHGHEYLGQVGSLSGIHLFKKKESTKHGVTHPHHDDSPEIKWSQNQIRKLRAKRNSDMNDPLYGQQWHLHQNPSLGNVHINIQSSWNQNITGHGVVIAIVDDGLEFTHGDLADNYVPEGSYDFNYQDDNPSPDLPSDDHGTSAAGVAGARDNSVCGVGSAFRAGLSGLRLISVESTDAEEASALNYRYDLNDIYSNSWGPIDDAQRLEGPGRLAELALQNGVAQGRRGLGSVFIWAAGNGQRSNDNCNYDGWANSRYTIAVAAVDYRGVQAWYSEPCSMIIVSAPSSGSSKSIATTDLAGSRGASSSDCTTGFGGTSAAAPLVAGVAALLLEANPSLSWRDVQAVLLSTASKNSPNDAGWITNGAGLHVNHKYGFGLVDASKAVEAAKKWVNLPENLEIDETNSQLRDIFDDTTVESTIMIPKGITVEHVEVETQIQHSRRGDLRISIISPSGTESVLAEPHNDNNADVMWKFRTVFSWGETSSGNWKLKIQDYNHNAKTGRLLSWTLRIFGH